MRKRIGFFGTTVLLGSVAFGQDLYTGKGTGSVTRLAGAGFRGAPLLDGFYFSFGSALNEPGSTDHHFGFVEVGADRPSWNWLTAGFGDKNSDDRFVYALSFHPRFGATALRSTGKLIGISPITLPLEPPPRTVFVLRGFRIGWQDGDHHVQRIAIVENLGELTVALEGGGSAFPFVSSQVFEVEVDYAYLPRDMVRRRWESRGESSGEFAEELIMRGTSVLAGFDLRFTNKDHHIRELGVWTPDDGRIQVFYSDQNADDPFVWSVQWVVLERDRGLGIDRPVTAAMLGMDSLVREAGDPSGHEHEAEDGQTELPVPGRRLVEHDPKGTSQVSVEDQRRLLLELQRENRELRNRLEALERKRPEPGRL
jgi:hypothetical protein